MQQHLPGGSALDFFSEPRQAILQALKAANEATTDQLARETYLSPGAVRQHLLALEAQGLVTFLRLRDGPGRPRHVFRLTSSGERLFPQLYAELAEIVLDAVAGGGEPLPAPIFQRLVAENVRIAKDVTAETPPERLQQLADVVDRWGFYSAVESAGENGADLLLRHCPLVALAGKYPDLCRIEREAMGIVLPNTQIVRTQHRIAGDAICVYRVAWEARQSASS